jgi:hypothetical protein
MTPPTRDPLLMGAKAIIWFFTGVFAFAAAAVLIAAPVVIAFQNRIVAEMIANGMKADLGVIGAIVLLLVCVAGLLALMVWFLVNLRKIVDSVRDGDPFAPINAARLARMGWIALGGQFAAIPVGAMALYLDSVIGDAHGKIGGHDTVHIQHDFGFSGGGILLVLVLFILARVFRHGAAMREDLEGTV